MAAVEADLDFGDEDDVEVVHDIAAIAALRCSIERHLQDNHVGERIRDGLSIAVVGAPNVGKSSLINVLARRDVAIVSSVPGTTRDIIELPLDLGGVPVVLIDTAGLRETGDPIEAEGIRRARDRARHADLVLHVVDAVPESPLGQIVVNKADLIGHSGGHDDGKLYVSAADGRGMADLEQWLVKWALTATHSDEPPLVSRRRHRVALEQCAVYLQEAEHEADVVLRAEALRLAARKLGEITGQVGVEEVLGEIFGRFCIGK
jgi:tRNA modification GTPase